MIRNSNLSPNLYQTGLLLIAITLPFNIYLNSLSIIITTIGWALQTNYHQKVKLFLNRPIIFLFVIFFIFSLAGLLYTENLKNGFFELEKKLSLLIIPLIVGTGIFNDSNFRNKILKSFVVSCLCVSLICLVNSTYIFLQEGDINQLFYWNLVSILGLHPIYFGAYLSFSIFIILYFLHQNKKKYTFSNKLLYYILISFFLIFIILLSARMVVFFTFITILLISFKSALSKKESITLIFTFFAFLGITFLSIYKVPFFKDRYLNLIHSDFNSIPEGDKVNGLTIRMVKWKCSLEGIKENPLLGVGTGDSQDYLNNCYLVKNFWGYLPDYQFNSHNQYLQTGLTFGIMGLLLLILTLIFPLSYAIKYKNKLLLILISLIAFNSLTESLLERQQGLVFFVFFVSVFLFSPDPQKNYLSQ
jgi:O-antigen ligase